MDMNWLALFVAALVPLLIGFLWYSNQAFGKAWMKSADITEEKMKGGNMAAIFGLTFLFSFMLTMILQSLVIHQTHIFSTLMNEPGVNDPNSETGKYLADFMARYGQNFRTFKHGAFHGVLDALFLALPILGINALFERRGGRYILIHLGYWVVTLALMGGIVSGWQ